MLIQVKVNERMYLKDPESSELGKKIIQHSILLIDEIGFECFTFRKLSERISSTEASVYRYFENKHKLLIYLVSWYWNWLEYRLMFAMNNIASPETRLEIAINFLSKSVSFDATFIHIDEEALHRIVVAESAKAYLTKEVDADNKEGYFASYKRLCKMIADIVSEIDPEYKYPRALVSSVIEAAHHQQYFSQHLPSLTEASEGDENAITDYLMDMVFRVVVK